jgi:hypothetical protein
LESQRMMLVDQYGICIIKQIIYVNINYSESAKKFIL